MNGERVSLVKICDHEDLVEISAFADPYRSWLCLGCPKIIREAVKEECHPEPLGSSRA